MSIDEKRMTTPSANTEYVKQDDNNAPKPWYRRISRKQWLICGGTTLVFIVAIILFLFFVVGRALAQKYANSVGIRLNYLDLNEFNPDGVHIQAEISLQITHESPFSADVSPFKAELYYDDKPIAIMDMPSMQLDSDIKQFNNTEKTQIIISDIQGWEKMNVDLIASTQIELSFKSSIKVSTMGTSYNDIELHKTITVKGFNQFSNPPPKINKMNIVKCGLDGIEMTINATMENVASVGLNGLGKLNITMLYDATNSSELGFAISDAENTGMPRGKSVQLMNSIIPVNKITRKSLTHMTGAYMGNTPINVTISGANPYATAAKALLGPIQTVRMHTTIYNVTQYISLDPKCFPFFLALDTMDL